MNEKTLLDGINVAHERHHNTEHPLTLLEAQVVLDRPRGRTRRERRARGFASTGEFGNTRVAT